MSRPVSLTRRPAAKKPRPTRTSKPRELKVYLLKNPDYYAKAVAAYSEAEAQELVGGEVQWIDDPKLLRKLQRQPGVVFQKLAGTKGDWEVWGG